MQNKPKAKQEKQTSTMTNSSNSSSNNANPFLQAIETAGTRTPHRPRFIPRPRPIFANTSILQLDINSNLSSMHNIVEYKDLNFNSPKFKMIKDLFPPSLVVLKIQQVFNPFLRLSFQLKQRFIYSNVDPLKLFHGTKLKYVHNICCYNFDWRFNGAEKGTKCGKGINFTPQPKFAMNFCDKDVKEKVVILSDVLVINKGIGRENLHLPPHGCDTAIREDDKTFVKFCDSEFYPRYVIFFCKASN